MSLIKKLSDKTINQIAAGEVVDRPASVVKELIENAIDAKSTKIQIEIEEGGKNLIAIIDNGIGMTVEDLNLCIERHTTSKLNEENLNYINSLGFRGEALPSIGSISNLAITTRMHDSEYAYCLKVSGNLKQKVIPASGAIGTKIEVRDLFIHTPVRLKFLRSQAVEKAMVLTVVQNFALSYPDIHFSLKSDSRIMLDYQPTDSLKQRLEDVMGKKFTSNMNELIKAADDMSITGFIGLPTFTQRNTVYQYIYINGRAIKDRQIYACIRSAYANIMSAHFYAAVLLNISIDPYEIDVNVHPSKTEIRFRDYNKVKNFIATTIRENLRSNISKVSTQITDNAHDVIVKSLKSYNNNKLSSNNRLGFSLSDNSRSIYQYTFKPNNIPSQVQSLLDKNREYQDTQAALDITDEPAHSLGQAIFQIHNTYIVARNKAGLVIVDQHAAHERLVLEKIGNNTSHNSQLLATPEVIDLSESLVEHLLSCRTQLEKFGILIERNGVSQVLVWQIPEFIKTSEIGSLIKEFADMIANDEDINVFELKKEQVYASIACHSSIRAGRKLSVEEMNAILRQIESTPLASQCNHGRPTFIVLEERHLAKIFERI